LLRHQNDTIFGVHSFHMNNQSHDTITQDFYAYVI
jgi:hypothetical protein